MSKVEEYIKNLTVHLIDENKNQWKVIEISDLEEIIEAVREEEQTFYVQLSINNYDRWMKLHNLNPESYDKEEMLETYYGMTVLEAMQEDYNRSK